MNKLIRDLAIEAGYEPFTPIQEAFEEFSIEQFAKLIVIQCAKAAEMANDIGLDSPEIYIIESLGFGTEAGAVNWWYEHKHLVESKSAKVCSNKVNGVLSTT